MYWHLNLHVSPKSVVWKDLFISIDKCVPTRKVHVFASLTPLAIPLPTHLASSKNWDTQSMEVNETGLTQLTLMELSILHTRKTVL